MVLNVVNATLYSCGIRRSTKFVCPFAWAIGLANYTVHTAIFVSKKRSCGQRTRAQSS